jgi:hypothetical protein
MRSNVRIPLSVNNSLGQPTSEAGVLPDPYGGGALHESEVYLTGWVHKGVALEGFLVIKKKTINICCLCDLNLYFGI